MFSQCSADGNSTMTFTRRQLLAAASARLETHLKRSIRASESREPPPSGRSVLHRFPLKLRHLDICGRRPLPALSRKHRRRFPGQPTSTAMGTTNLARRREPGNGCIPPAVRMKSIVLRGNSPQTPSLRRASNKATILRGSLPMRSQGPSARQLTVTNSNAPSSPRPDKYKSQQPLMDLCFKTRIFSKLQVVRGQSCVAAGDPRLTCKIREGGHGVDHTCAHRHWLAVQVHRGMRRDAARGYVKPKCFVAIVCHAVLPLSPLPWAHDKQVNPFHLAGRFGCTHALEPSFETPVHPAASSSLASCPANNPAITCFYEMQVLRHPCGLCVFKSRKQGRRRGEPLRPHCFQSTEAGRSGRWSSRRWPAATHQH
ncbi:hypothetical protein HPB50_003880 [Hyalomma asiaticum]|uniref:Uncharacterized protein n=1 Tax=Hyalomma asiaticum TaxID=266040 RepID=A0ACB7RV57_HYAAI|nr:hypothetical protein HPB50_003880 [Hyalomma asiaticum]